MPNRILKESIRTDKRINTLNDFQFRVWAYLITYVDDFGRGSAEPDIIKGFVFPRRKSVTEANIVDALGVLASTGLIRLYEVGGDSYLYFPDWEEHQNRRASTSKFPEPPTSDSTCNQLQADDSNCMQTQAYAPDTRISILDTRNSILDTRNSARSRGDSTVLEDFARFYKAYPRKVSKQNALKAWKALKVDTETVEVILADVQRRCETEWKGQAIQYIPHPATYLNQRRWEDETAPTARREQPQRAEPANNPALDYQQRQYSAEDDESFYTDLDALLGGIADV